MAHDLDRVIQAFAWRAWAIEEKRGLEIVHALALRQARGPRAEPFREEAPAPAPADERRGKVAVLRLHGPLVPRASAVTDVSAPFASVERFVGTFRRAANDAGVSAIVLDIDSPGGMVDLVPEAAAMVRDARREARPIFAVANTIAASAAYWIASQADRFFASPSALVGSIGVRAMHEDISARLKQLGVARTHIHAGPRKIEGTPDQPLDRVARAALQAEVDAAYDVFVADVARGRGVTEAVVRADPEKAEAHMGGGRAYHAARALALGMVDEIATIDQVIARAAEPRGAGARRSAGAVATARRRLALI